MRDMWVVSRGVHAIAALILLVLGHGTVTLAQNFDLNSKAALLMDYQSGRVLYEHNAHEALPPASVTKIMTLVLALEAVRDGRLSLDDLVSTSDYAARMGGTQIWLEPGERMPLRDLLYAIAVGSANDAAVAVAEHIAGSEPAFVEMMNDKARELGMEKTRFANPSGLPPESVGKEGPHVMSAHDIALLSRYALTLPMFPELVSTWGPVTMRADTVERPILWSYNRMMRSYPGMDGIKTGMTNAAGFCLSATAERDGLRLIAVTLGASTSQERDQDIRRLLDYGFSRLRAVPVAEEGDAITQIEVVKGKEKELTLVAGEGMSISMERDASTEPTTRIEMIRQPVAPITRGESLGYLIAILGGEEVSRVPLLAAEDVERASVFQLIARIFLQLVQVSERETI